MSKTYNQRHHIKTNRPKYEYPNGFNPMYHEEIEPGEVKTFDYSHSTDNISSVRNDREITRMNCRHPNKKKHRKLLKEFRNTGVDYFGTSYVGFDHRLGDINMRRQRKSVIRIGNEKRRFKLKKETKRIIKDELENI